MSKKKVFVGMSGGVDSSVAAALLKKRGFDVYGVFMKNWAPSARASTELSRTSSGQVDPELPCTWKEDRRDAMRVAAKLDIPFQTWDFTREYRQSVIDYMIREYAAGRTPNPDVMCNRMIKFGLFLKEALRQGADYIATGHYMRKREIKMQNAKCKIQVPEQARDLNKDQSYFLWTLTQEQLQHCLFPIGEYTKPEVRELARKFNLPTAEKEESQGICFIGEIDVADFLKRSIPERRGTVRTTAGKVVGEHEGVEFYTIGQREGIGIGGGIPYYVVEKDTKSNTLVVAEGPYDEKLFRSELVATDIHWITGSEPKFPLRCQARIRYRQPLQQAQLVEFPISNFQFPNKSKIQNPKAKTFKVTFDESQRAITPGQSVVFYKGEEMLGGGIIV